MINDIVYYAISLLDIIFNFKVIQDFIDIIQEFNTLLQTGSTLFVTVLQGLYFIFGKNLVIFALTTFFVIVAVKIVMSIVNVVSQFIP